MLKKILTVQIIIYMIITFLFVQCSDKTGEIISPVLSYSKVTAKDTTANKSTTAGGNQLEQRIEKKGISKIKERYLIEEGNAGILTAEKRLNKNIDSRNKVRSKAKLKSARLYGGERLLQPELNSGSTEASKERFAETPENKTNAGMVEEQIIASMDPEAAPFEEMRHTNFNENTSTEVGKILLRKKSPDISSFSESLLKQVASNQTQNPASFSSAGNSLETNYSSANFYESLQKKEVNALVQQTNIKRGFQDLTVSSVKDVDNNTVLTAQLGINNNFEKAINGAFNGIRLIQMGDNNSADVNIAGDYNLSNITQIGNGNVSRVEQKGSGNKVEIHQTSK